MYLAGRRYGSICVQPDNDAGKVQAASRRQFDLVIVIEGPEITQLVDIILQLGVDLCTQRYLDLVAVLVQPVKRFVDRPVTR